MKNLSTHRNLKLTNFMKREEIKKPDYTAGIRHTTVGSDRLDVRRDNFRNKTVRTAKRRSGLIGRLFACSATLALALGACTDDAPVEQPKSGGVDLKTAPAFCCPDGLVSEVLSANVVSVAADRRVADSCRVVGLFSPVLRRWHWHSVPARTTPPSNNRKAEALT